jgi:alkylated DNA nucleotide flippase Atl1
VKAKKFKQPHCMAYKNRLCLKQEVAIMANEDKKDFNAMLHDSKDMPKFQTITDEKSIEKYGGDRMYFAPPIDYDRIMKCVPYGKVITVGKIRDYFAEQNGADFTEPITAGIFVSIAAWASYQRSEDETPYWRTLKANGELNAKYPGGIEAQKEKLEAEGHRIIQRGRKNISYYVKDYEKAMFELN